MWALAGERWLFAAGLSGSTSASWMGMASAVLYGGRVRQRGLSTDSVMCQTPGQVWCGGGVGRRLTPPPLPFSEAPPHVPVLLGPPVALRLLGDVNGVMHRAVLGGRLATQAHGT